MLACARIGAVHSVVFGGFAPHELADPHRRRPAHGRSCRPAAASSRAGSWSTSRSSTRRSSSPSTSPAAVVLKQRPQVVATMVEGRDVDWDVAMRAGRTEPAECVEVAATDPLYVLYTSGTTGKPKGIVRDNGGHAVAMAWSLPNIYGVDPGDVWWAASDVGLGRRPLLHRLRPAAHRCHDGALRGQAGRHPGRRRLLAGDRGARREGAVHRTDRDPGDQEGGPGGRPAGRPRHLQPAARCSWPASDSTPTPTTGPPTGSASR